MYKTYIKDNKMYFINKDDNKIMFSIDGKSEQQLRYFWRCLKYHFQREVNFNFGGESNANKE